MNRFHWTKREFVFGVTALIIALLLCLSWWQPFSQSKQAEGDLSWDDAAQQDDSPKSSTDAKDSDKEPEEVVVDVKGAVKSTGVYKVSSSKRVVDVIDEAGGFAKKADQKQINLAERVRDEMVIEVPKKGEKPHGGAHGGSSTIDENGGGGDEKISLNSAEAADFEKLPGIGPQKAKTITDYREKHGPFKKVEDLLNVSGIGDKTLEKLKDELRL